MRALLLVLLFMAYSANLSAAGNSLENNFALRAGLSFNHIKFETDKIIDNTEDEDDEKNEVETQSYGFSTSFAYRFTSWEVGAGSDVFFGKIADTTFINDNSSLRGDGRFRVVTINPFVKYYTPFAPFNRISIYFGMGPSWSLQTFSFKNIQSTGSFNNKRKITFENYGGSLFIGIEEILPYKEMHPTFLEIGYSYMNSYKVAIIDATKEDDVVTLSEKASREFSGHYIIVRFGITLF
jgi:hypothetical protein